MEILWYPERGSCSWCDNRCEVVRGYSDTKKFSHMCFACWNAQQVGCVVSSEEWTEEASIIFTPSNSEKSPVGTPSGPFPN